MDSPTKLEQYKAIDGFQFEPIDLTEFSDDHDVVAERVKLVRAMLDGD